MFVIEVFFLQIPGGKVDRLPLPDAVKAVRHRFPAALRCGGIVCRKVVGIFRFAPVRACDRGDPAPRVVGRRRHKAVSVRGGQAPPHCVVGIRLGEAGKRAAVRIFHPGNGDAYEIGTGIGILGDDAAVRRDVGVLGLLDQLPPRVVGVSGFGLQDVVDIGAGLGDIFLIRRECVDRADGGICVLLVFGGQGKLIGCVVRVVGTVG